MTNKTQSTPAETALDIAVTNYVKKIAIGAEPVLRALLDYSDEKAWSNVAGTVVAGLKDNDGRPLRHVLILDLKHRAYSVSTTHPGRLLSFTKSPTGALAFIDADTPQFADDPDIGVSWSASLGTIFRTAANNIDAVRSTEAGYLRRLAEKLDPS